MNEQDRLAEILRLSDGLNGAELRELSERIEQDPATQHKILWQDLETRFQKAKRLWATLTMNGDRRTFKEGLQRACSTAKSLWATLGQLEHFEAWRARTELRERLQSAYDMGLTFQKAFIDGQSFHVDNGLVVEGEAEGDTDDSPF